MRQECAVEIPSGKRGPFVQPERDALAGESSPTRFRGGETYQAVSTERRALAASQDR
jgi:hypothetical protein